MLVQEILDGITVIKWRHLVDTIEWFVCTGDAFCQINLTTYFTVISFKWPILSPEV